MKILFKNRCFILQTYKVFSSIPRICQEKHLNYDDSFAYQTLMLNHVVMAGICPQLVKLASNQPTNQNF